MGKKILTEKWPIQSIAFMLKLKIGKANRTEENYMAAARDS